MSTPRIGKESVIIKVAGPKGEHFEMGWEILTPAKAGMYLTNQGRQRDLSDVLVSRYAASIQSGKWDDVVGDPLIFDTKGRMQSGQHRCKGVVLAQRPIIVFVIRGVRDDAYYNIDGGKARTLEDTLHIEGENYAKQLSVVLRALYQFSIGQHGSTAPVSLDNRTAYQFLKKHPGLQVTIQRTNARISTMPVRLASQAALAYLTYIVEHISLEKARSFMRIIFSEALPKPDTGCPASLMVLKLQESRNATQRHLRLTAKERLANLVKAWNLFVVDRRVPNVRSISWRIDEDWPEFRDDEGQIVLYKDITFNAKDN
jgi:hypothetical protein